MKKNFLILPALLFSFLIGANVLAVGVDKTTYSSLDDKINITYNAPFTWAVIDYETGAQLSQHYGADTTIEYSVQSLGITELKDFHILFFTPGTLANSGTYCPSPLREYPCVWPLYASYDYEITFVAPPAPALTATSSLIMLGNALGGASVDLTLDVFANWWPFILIISIIFIFTAYFTRFLIGIIKK